MTNCSPSRVRGAVERSVLPARPPATVYRLTKVGERLARTVGRWSAE